MDQKETASANPSTTPNSTCPKCLTEIGELINLTWQLYQQKVFTCVKIQLIPVVPAILLGVLASIIVLAIAPTLNSTSGIWSTIIIIAAIIIGLIILIVGLIVTAWFQSALMVAVSDQENLGVWAIYKKAAKYIFPFIWIIIIAALTCLTGYIFLIIPGIILTIWFYFAGWALINQDQSGFDALAKSKALVSGKWWDILARLIILGIIVYLINIAIAIVVMPITFVTAIFKLEIIGNIIQIILSIFTVPIPILFTYLIYKNLVAIKPEATLPKPSKTWMIVFAIIAVVLIIGGILLALAVGAFGALFSSNILRNTI